MPDSDKISEMFKAHQAGCKVCIQPGRALCPTGTELICDFARALAIEVMEDRREYRKRHRREKKAAQ